MNKMHSIQKYSFVYLKQIGLDLFLIVLQNKPIKEKHSLQAEMEISYTINYLKSNSTIALRNKHQ